MRVLVTGAGGFVGHWACKALTGAGHEVIPSELLPPSPDVATLDVTQPVQIEAILKDHRPDACLHLGGIAFVPLGWEKPDLVYRVNTLGTLNLLEGLRAHAPKAKLLMVSSAEVYGRESRDHPVRESDSLNPSNLYAVSKAAADQSVLLYAQHYGMHTMTARPQNHIGPGQHENFVAASFARQISNIAAGSAPGEMNVGNLDALRDFLDVRDVAEGYRRLLEEGHAGEAYNLASGKPLPIRTILDTLCELTDCHPDVTVDPARYREENESPILITEKIRAHTGWSPAYDLKRTLSDLLASLK
jgi:GDP-4-dehydro-6-deoxy-D-mannose reductase